MNKTYIYYKLENGLVKWWHADCVNLAVTLCFLQVSKCFLWQKKLRKCTALHRCDVEGVRTWMREDDI
jgi:hypothetical protein